MIGNAAKRKQFIVNFNNKAQKKFKAIMDALKVSFKKDLKVIKAKINSGKAFDEPCVLLRVCVASCACMGACVGCVG